MKFGLHVPNFGQFADPVLIGELAAAADASGWDGYFLWDHIARWEGVFPMCEPWVGLTVAATATERVLLGLLVTPLPRRRPWNVARQVATLDHLSGGRMVFGVGIGVSGTEFDDFGEVSDPRIRGDILDEGLAIVRAAWTGEPVIHRGAHFRVDGVALLPRPVQPRIPIWGATERVRGRPVRRAAALDGVFPVGLNPEQGRELLDVIAGLRPGGLEGYELVAAGEDGSWEAWRDAGATWWLRGLPWAGTAAEARAIIDAGPPEG